MRYPAFIFALIVLSALASGCIVSDEARTYYLLPDGRIEIHLHWDEVRSDAQDAKERTKEQNEWLVDFKKGKLDVFKNIQKAGGTMTQKTLLRGELPYVAVARAMLPATPGGKALAKHFDLLGPTDTSPEADSLEISSSGKTRKLSLRLAGKKKEASPSKHSTEYRLYPVVKFVPVGGTLKSSKNCILNETKQSCRVDLKALEEATAAGKAFTLELEWEL